MTKPALAICAFTIAADPARSEFQLFPAGRFRAQDGRPHEVPAGWYMDGAIAEQIITASRQRKNDFVLDYEHQTINSEQNGQPAPAAAWWRDMEWREGDGLYAINVNWRARAKQYIADDEYRYISPVFPYDPDTGAVLGIYNAGLTNDPALDGMAQAVAAARRQFLPDEQQTETPMLEELLKALGLHKDTTEEQAVEAVASLKKDYEEADKQLKARNKDLAVLKRVRKELDLPADASDADQIGQAVAALKSNTGGKPDPSKYVPAEQFESLKTEVVALRAERTADEVEDLVQSGLDDGRLFPAQEDWARELGKSNVAQLKAYLASAQPVAALKRSQTNGEQPKDDKGNAVLTDNQKAVCKRMGISEEEYAKSLPASA